MDNIKLEQTKKVLNEVRVDRDELNEMIKTLRGYGYDSLCLRYNAARDAQAEYEIYRMHKDNERAWDQAKRDKLRFYQILDELIGEHN